ncbi:MAG: DEAD/DEAH box helicase, partial [Candidatus Micrarchaeota archaeon]
DQMLDMGFLDEVTAILDQLPQARMTLLVSATLDENIMSIASKYVPSPDTIEVGEIEAAATISQEHIEATEREKFPRLLEVLRSHEGMKILVFRETKKGAARLQERLWERGCKCGVLEGDMSQAQRNRTLADFKEGRIKMLVATNVAARGLHIDDLGLIVNYDKAQSEEIHLHRIGRTGRMGQAGKAINFVVRKESLDERMSSDHPDFAWMKQGGTDFYRQGRGWGPGGGSREGGGHGERPRYGDRGGFRHGRGGSRYGERSHGSGQGGHAHSQSRGGGREHGGERHGGQSHHGGERPHGDHRRHRRPY